MNFKQKYTEEIDKLNFSSNFEAILTENLSKAVVRKENLVMKKNKNLKILITVIAAVLLFSVSAFALNAFLSAKDVANELGETELALKFENSNTTPETAQNEIYTVSLLGTATSKELNTYDGIEIEKDRSFFVVAVSRNDGTALNIVDGSPIQLSPVIEGCEPWRINLWSLGSNASGIERDGVLYYLFDTENLQIFADRKVYIAAYEGHIPNTDILVMNEDGSISFNESYTGFKALFQLSLDASKAAPEKANEILSQFE